MEQSSIDYNNTWCVLKPDSYKDWLIKPKGGIVYVATEAGYLVAFYSKELFMEEYNGKKLRGHTIQPSEILGLYFDYGEMIEVSNDEKNWKTVKFSHYEFDNVVNLGSKGLIYRQPICDLFGQTFKFARRTQKKQYDIAIFEKSTKHINTTITQEQYNKIQEILGEEL